jgi:hypothetical protein
LRHGADFPQKLLKVQPQWIVVEYPHNVPREMFELLERSGFTVADRFDGWADWTNGDVIVYRRG